MPRSPEIGGHEHPLSEVKQHTPEPGRGSRLDPHHTRRDLVTSAREISTRINAGQTLDQLQQGETRAISDTGHGSDRSQKRRRVETPLEPTDVGLHDTEHEKQLENSQQQYEKHQNWRLAPEYLSGRDLAKIARGSRTFARHAYDTSREILKSIDLDVTDKTTVSELKEAILKTNTEYSDVCKEYRKFSDESKIYSISDVSRVLDPINNGAVNIAELAQLAIKAQKKAKEVPNADLVEFVELVKQAKRQEKLRKTQEDFQKLLTEPEAIKGEKLRNIVLPLVKELYELEQYLKDVRTDNLELKQSLTTLYNGSKQFGNLFTKEPSKAEKRQIYSKKAISEVLEDINACQKEAVKLAKSVIDPQKVAGNKPDAKLARFVRRIDVAFYKARQEKFEQYRLHPQPLSGTVLKDIVDNLREQTRQTGTLSLDYLKPRSHKKDFYRVTKSITDLNKEFTKIRPKNNFIQESIYEAEDTSSILNAFHAYQQEVRKLVDCTIQAHDQITHEIPDSKLIRFMEQVKDASHEREQPMDISESEGSDTDNDDHSDVASRSRHRPNYSFEYTYTPPNKSINKPITIKIIVAGDWQKDDNPKWYEEPDKPDPGYYLTHKDGHRAFVPYHLMYSYNAFSDALQKASLESMDTDAIHHLLDHQADCYDWDVQHKEPRPPTDMASPGDTTHSVGRQIGETQDFWSNNVDTRTGPRKNPEPSTFRGVVASHDYYPPDKRTSAFGWKYVDGGALAERHVVIWLANKGDRDAKNT